MRLQIVDNKFLTPKGLIHSGCMGEMISLAQWNVEISGVTGLTPARGPEVGFLLVDRETQAAAQAQDMLKVARAQLRGGGQCEPVVEVDPQADTSDSDMKA